MRSILVLVVLFSAPPASATIMDLGDRVLDTETGLVWLDWNQTARMSFADVAASPLVQTEGWRIASTIDLCTLAADQDACWVAPSDGHPLKDASIAAALTQSSLVPNAMTFDSSTPGFRFYANITQPHLTVSPRITEISELFSSPTFGVALVRRVAEPRTGALLLTALLLLGGPRVRMANQSAPFDRRQPGPLVRGRPQRIGGALSACFWRGYRAFEEPPPNKGLQLPSARSGLSATWGVWHHHRLINQQRGPGSRS